MTHGTNASRVRGYRLRDSCAALVRLSRYVPEHGMNKAAREVARALFSHFEAEILHHRVDQEMRLFAALRAGASRHEIAELDALIDHLTNQHREIERTWHPLRLTLMRIGSCRPTALSPAHSTRFAELCLDHTAMEDASLSAMTIDALDQAACSRLAAHLDTDAGRFDGAAGRIDGSPRMAVSALPIFTSG